MVARFVLTLALVASILSSAHTGPASADDAKNIQGVWKIVALDGPDKLPADELKKLRLHITADSFTVKASGKEVSVSPYKLVAGKNPAQIDLIVKVLIDRGTVVESQKQTRLGIYELKGDDLKICVVFDTNKKTPNPQARPTEFKTGGDLTLLVLKRASKD